MTTPTPRNIKYELYVNNAWVDVTTDVLDDPGISITRGRRDEAGRTEPARLEATLLNNSGNYSPRNPTGAYYGSLGLNTPLRVTLIQSQDSFNRTVNNGWGNNDNGQAWTNDLTQGGGTVQNSDWSVVPGAGRQSVPIAAGYRISYIQTPTYRDVDVRVDVTLSLSSITGGAVEPANIILRGTATNVYYLARMQITTTGAVQLVLLDNNGSVLTGPTTVNGLTYSSGAPIRVRAQIEGQTLRMKAWAATGVEPYGWLITAQTTAAITPGWVGIRSGVATGNTNTKPIVFSYANMVVSSPRFMGELSDLRVRWDRSGQKCWAETVFQGITRRLSQGQPPLSSSFRRATLAVGSALVAYWPCEDDVNATQLSSALPSAPPMIVNGSTKFANYTILQTSKPLPVLNGAYWDGLVPAYTTPSPNKIQLMWLMTTPFSPEIPNASFLIDIHNTGTAGLWRVMYYTDGALGVQAWGNAFSGTAFFDSGAFAFNIKSKPVLAALELTQNGANVDWKLVTLAVGETSGLFINGTVTSRTIGAATRVFVDPLKVCAGAAIGHISVRNTITNIFNMTNELNAFNGETAGQRLSRLTSQLNIPFSYIGDLTATPRMGPQQAKSLLSLLDECADLDMGLLYEPKGDIGLAYRTRSSLFNQNTTLDLDYAAGQVFAPFEPVDDDTRTRNDVRATRNGGGEARVTVDTGRKGTADPSAGGAGRYETSLTLNSYDDGWLTDVAAWTAWLGTYNGDARYPQINIDLTSPSVVNAGKDTLALTVDVGDRLTVSNPFTKHNPNQISQLALGYSENIRNYTHTLRFNCAPESVYQIASVNSARIDSDTSTLTGGPYSPSATSLQVTTSSLWSTNSGDYPVDVNISGEIVRVTSVTGASSPQTFTVTRAINGVSKTLTAGAQVSLAQRPTVGY